MSSVNNAYTTIASTPSKPERNSSAHTPPAKPTSKNPLPATSNYHNGPKIALIR